MRQLDLSVWRDPLLIENAWKKSWPPESVAELIAEETLLNSSVHKQLVRFACDCAEYGLLHLEELAKELAHVIQGIRNWIEGTAETSEVLRLAEVAYNISSRRGPDPFEFGVAMRDSMRTNVNYACNAVQSAAESVDYLPNIAHVLRWLINANGELPQNQTRAELAERLKDSFTPFHVLYGQRSHLNWDLDFNGQNLLQLAKSSNDPEHWYVLADLLEELGDPRFIAVREIGTLLIE